MTPLSYASMYDEEVIASCHSNWRDFIVAVGLRLRELEATGLYGEPTACRGVLIEAGRQFGMSLREAAHVLRVVVTGKASGFCLYKTLEILGMDEVGKRIVYLVTYGQGGGGFHLYNLKPANRTPSVAFFFTG